MTHQFYKCVCIHCGVALDIWTALFKNCTFSGTFPGTATSPARHNVVLDIEQPDSVKQDERLPRGGYF